MKFKLKLIKLYHTVGMLFEKKFIMDRKSKWGTEISNFTPKISLIPWSHLHVVRATQSNFAQNERDVDPITAKETHNCHEIAMHLHFMKIVVRGTYGMGF